MVSSAWSPPALSLDTRRNCNDRWPLHYACRIGSLRQVQYLVEVLKYDVHSADDFDTTPLYLAALIGSTEICRYLLEQGAAKCAGHDDMARVFYVALTPELRTTLREWSVSAALRNPFLESLSREFNHAQHADCIVQLPHDDNDDDDNEQVVHCHAIMLQATCPKLAALITPNEDNNDNNVPFQLQFPHHDYNNNNSSSNDAIKLLLQYLYTGVLETQNVQTALACQNLSRKYGLTVLEQELDKALLNRYSSSKHQKSSFRCHVSDMDTLQSNMRQLARWVSTPTTTTTTASNNENEESSSQRLPACNDVTLQCHNETFALHQFRLCRESEYVSRALSGNFKESVESYLDLTELLHGNSQVLRLAIQWLYCNAFLDDNKDVNTMVQVLEFAFCILCPRLATYTTQHHLIPVTNRDNVLDMMHLARVYGLKQLEDKCVQVIGDNLEQLVLQHEDEIVHVLQDEAACIRQGGNVRAADVPLAAEIRRSIQRNEHLSAEKKNATLVLLEQVVQQALGKSDDN